MTVQGVRSVATGTVPVPVCTGVGHRDSGDPPPHASGWVLVQLVFQSVVSFLVGGDDWGGLSFPYWVFLPPA